MAGTTAGNAWPQNPPRPIRHWRPHLESAARFASTKDTENTESELCKTPRNARESNHGLHGWA